MPERRTSEADPRIEPGAGPATAAEEVLVLDFGGQYSQLIARRIRECGVFSELLPHDTPIEAIRERQPQALVLSGGPASVYAEDAPALRTELLELGIPVLGHLLRDAADGPRARRQGRAGAGRRVRPHRADAPRRRGQAARRAPGRAAVLDEPPRHRLRAAAGLRRARLQPASRRSPRSRTPARGLYGIQFHPEVVHTPHGTEVLTRFLRDIAGCRERWSPASVIDEQVEAIRAQVGDARAICGLSGGVDSATAALLVHRAIGDRLTCVFVDHGMMRKDEAEQVVEAFRDRLGVPLIHVDAADRFLDRLAGRRRPRDQAQDHRRGVHPRLRARRRRRSRTPASWSRGRSTPT